MKERSSVKRRVVQGSIMIALACGAVTVAFAQARPPVRTAIPTGTGWFCFEDPSPRGGSNFTCDRPLRACEQVRSQRHAAGENVGTCAAEPVAYCFTYRDNTQRPATTAHYCARQPAQCESMRGSVEGSAPMFTNVSACAEFH